MAKQQKTQQYCLKLHSSFLARHNWDLTLSIDDARKSPGVIVALADSQILTWINELNGTENYDQFAKEIQQEIKSIKKQKRCATNKAKIKDLYDNLYKTQFREDYVNVIMDSKRDYDRANMGFKINGIEYRRLLTTTNGVKTSTVVYTSVRLLAELKRRIECGRNVNVPLVPAKLGAYEALCASASIPVSSPKGIIVVKDCYTKFNADIINIDDSDTTKEPIVDFVKNQEVVNDASDGCSMMLPSLSKRWCGELTGDYDNMLSGCNLRCAWIKGMTFTFDFIEWTEKNIGSYFIEDIWGVRRDIRCAELILTESQFKLWSSYSSWEDYAEKCINCHYSFRVAKTAPDVLDDVRQLNYQFIQPHDMSDDDINELIGHTVNEIKDIMGMDYKKSIVYLAGTGLSENNWKSADVAAKALMINKNMIDDPYIRSRIKKMIQKRIKDAKIGVLDVYGNFQILSGDLVALCESMFGLEPKGVLGAGEIFSQYWQERNVSQVVCYRAPMSNSNSIVTQNISYSDEASYWFRYIKTCVIVNAWDTMPMALNGFDFDGDLLFTTNNPVLLRTHENLPALNCIQYKADKKIVDEQDVVQSNKLGFGSHIGAITNRITSMTSLMANYERGSVEYEVLKYRTQCGQAQQQAEIDKAKGITSNPMPKSWYIYSENKIDYDKDSAKEIDCKKLYQKVCANKKPYFFIYNYDDLYKKYRTYQNDVNNKSQLLFQQTILELEQKENKTDLENDFLQWVKNKCPLDMSKSVMNRICWMIEKEFDDFFNIEPKRFYPDMIKSGYKYSFSNFKEIESLWKWYKRQVREFSKNLTVPCDDFQGLCFDDLEQLQLYFKEKCDEICPNQYELCDILIDLCYKSKNSKDIVWFVCGDTIIENLLKTNNHNLYYPERVCGGEEFWCKGFAFVMKKVNVGDVAEEVII